MSFNRSDVEKSSAASDYSAVGDAFHAAMSPAAAVATRDGRRRRAELAHSQENIITEKRVYACTTCAKTFHRKSILRRHVDYTHNASFVSDDGSDDADDGGGGGGGEMEGTGETATTLVQRTQRQAAADGDVAAEDKSKPHACPDCFKRFKEVSAARCGHCTDFA